LFVLEPDPLALVDLACPERLEVEIPVFGEEAVSEIYEL
jgi:hypothetical protein